MLVIFQSSFHSQVCLWHVVYQRCGYHRDHRATRPEPIPLGQVSSISQCCLVREITKRLWSFSSSTLDFWNAIYTLMWCIWWQSRSAYFQVGLCRFQFLADMLFSSRTLWSSRSGRILESGNPCEFYHCCAYWFCALGNSSILMGIFEEMSVLSGWRDTLCMWR